MLKKINVGVVLVILAIAILSCNKGDAKESTQIGDFKLELLFEQNGCKMYRFEDGRRYIYWSDCQGRVQSDYTTSNGKTSSTHRFESITTK